jgi:uncharacterized protein (TIGR02996 family)
MNEEPALLAAVVANPDDDTNRLVYADWLDERDDPRGAYLRAEVACSKSRAATDEALARSLVRALDAVWCARVSRPPLGVCCNRVRIAPRPQAGPVASGDLDRLEKRFRIAIPPDYRAFLLNYNGGSPAPGHLRIPARRYRAGGYDCVTALHGVYTAVDAPRLRERRGNDWDPDLVFCLRQLEWFRTPTRLRGPYRGYAQYWGGESHRDLVHIGYGDPNGQNEIYCITVRGVWFGKVFYVATGPGHDCDDGDCIPVADTFAAFLALLTKHHKPKKPRSRKPKS